VLPLEDQDHDYDQEQEIGENISLDIAGIVWSNSFKPI
jgi:hypothetical protein